MAKTDINSLSGVGAQGALGAGQAESLDLHSSLEKEGRCLFYNSKGAEATLKIYFLHQKSCQFWDLKLS